MFYDFHFVCGWVESINITGIWRDTCVYKLMRDYCIFEIKQKKLWVKIAFQFYCSICIVTVKHIIASYTWHGINVCSTHCLFCQHECVCGCCLQFHYLSVTFMIFNCFLFRIVFAYESDNIHILLLLFSNKTQNKNIWWIYTQQQTAQQGIWDGESSNWAHTLMCMK